MDDSVKRLAFHLKSITGTFALEGITLDDEDITDCRAVLSGDVDADKLAEQLLETYRKDAVQASNDN